MSEAGLRFMNDWVRRNVVSSPFSRDYDERVERYTAACLAEAAGRDLTRADIEEDIGDIGDYIRDAMNEAANEELHSDAASDE